MRPRTLPAPTDQCAVRLRLFLSCPLIALLGCVPAERLPDPVDWPREWDGRTLWTTPHAFIYAKHGAAADEIDRVVAHARRAYLVELDQPAPPVLIIVRDTDEPYPGNDLRAVLRSTFRVALQRDPGEVADNPDAETLEQPTPEAVDEAILELLVAAAAAGTTVQNLAGTMPLTYDADALRQVCAMADARTDRTDGALILPTRAALRTHVRRMMQGTLTLFGIGPAAQVLFAPVLIIGESKTVDQLDGLRRMAIFNHWLFEFADLPIEQKRAIARARAEELSGQAAAAAAAIAGTGQ